MGTKPVSVPFRGSISSNAASYRLSTLYFQFPSPSGDLYLQIYRGMSATDMMIGFRPLPGIYIFKCSVNALPEYKYGFRPLPGIYIFKCIAFGIVYDFSFRPLPGIYIFK